MEPERWRRAKDLFQAALEHEPGERTAFLEQECVEDPALLAEVASLLARHVDDSFIERPAPEVMGASVIPSEDLGLRSCPTCSSCYGDGRLACPEDGASLVEELPGPPVLDSKYVIERRLGHGGMGVVYRARHTGLGRTFALKLIRPGAAAKAEFVARFAVEAAALGRLKHPGIVDVTDFGVDRRGEGVPYLVMEHLEGTSLHDFARRAGAVPLDQALPILAGVAEALDFAHVQGILHRDLKEANVFLCAGPHGSPTPKILDFGLARLLVPGSPGADVPAELDRTRPSLPALPLDPAVGKSVGPVPTMSLNVLVGPSDAGALRPERITAPGRGGGTLGYLAPEVLLGRDATTSSDVYAFAVMAYRLLVGRLPFEGTDGEMIRGHVSGTPQRPSALRTSVPAEVDGPLLDALSKDSAARPPARH